MMEAKSSLRHLCLTYVNIFRRLKLGKDKRQFWMNNPPLSMSVLRAQGFSILWNFRVLQTCMFWTAKNYRGFKVKNFRKYKIYIIVSYKGSNKTHWRSEANVITSGFYQLWARQFIQLSHFWSCSLLSRIEALKERIVAWTSVHRNGKIRNDTRLA